jgi:hypothetical protein
MINQQLLDYIKQQQQQNISKEQIKSALTTNGWQQQDVDDAFSFISSSVSTPSQVPPPAQTISSLPSATAIFGQAWAVYKQRLGTFLGVMAIPIISGSGYMAMILFLSKALSISPSSTGLLLLIPIVFIIFLIIIAVQIWGQTALLYAIKDSQEKIGVVESYRRGWHKILSYWWIGLLMAFITIGGFILLVVPGIIFATWFSLAVFVLIAEDLKGMNALLKSKEYVKGKFGSVFWRLFFIGVISFVISLVPIIFFSILKIPFGSQINNLIIGLFVTPLVMTYSFLVYSSLKAIKGEYVFVPTAGKKTIFVTVGIIGFLIIPAIGILSSIVLASLNTSRYTGANNAIKANLANVRAEAALYYDNNSRSYGTPQSSSCANTAGTLWSDPIMQSTISAITYANSAPVCNSVTGAWAISAALKVAEAGSSYWCVDSTGVSKGESANLSSGIVVCP